MTKHATCPHGEAHSPRVCAVHQALAEGAGIYDLTDDEAGDFLREFDRIVTTPSALAATEDQ